MKVSEIKIGETYNGVKVLEDLGYHKGGRRYLCKCPRCNGTFELQQYKVGITQTCRDCYIERGCDNVIGRKFGRLTVLSFSHTEKGHAYVNCQCDCGNVAVVNSHTLKHGGTRSCGCLAIDMRSKYCIYTKGDYNIKGKFSRHPLFRIWGGIMQRCFNPNSHAYELYGGRGISVCNRWSGENGFGNFLADMGERPGKEYSIDRIDVNGDYCPENCRWATWIEQANNKTNNSYVYVSNTRYTISTFHRMRKIKRSLGSFCAWLKRGLDINFLLATDGKSYKEAELRKQLKKHINFNRIVYEN